jgi:hypothetical protein
MNEIYFHVVFCSFVETAVPTVQPLKKSKMKKHVYFLHKLTLNMQKINNALTVVWEPSIGIGNINMGFMLILLFD